MDQKTVFISYRRALSKHLARGGRVEIEGFVVLDARCGRVRVRVSRRVTCASELITVKMTD